MNMATKKTPRHDTWMPLYVSDYLSDTMHLNAEQHGAYLLLLMAAWKADGKLPHDSGTLQQITRMTAPQWSRAEPILMRFFFITEDFWIHNRVRTELVKAKEMVDKKSAAGKKAAAVKWGLRVD